MNMMKAAKGVMGTGMAATKAAEMAKKMVTKSRPAMEPGRQMTRVNGDSQGNKMALRGGGGGKNC